MIYKCKKCGKEYKAKHWFEKHECNIEPKKQKVYKCKKCGKEYKLESNFKKHKCNINKRPKKIEIYKCEKCGKEYKLKKTFEKHKCEIKTPQKTKNIKNKIYSCPYCQKTYKQKNSYDKHLNICEFKDYNYKDYIPLINALLNSELLTLNQSEKNSILRNAAKEKNIKFINDRVLLKYKDYFDSAILEYFGFKYKTTIMKVDNFLKARLLKEHYRLYFSFLINEYPKISFRELYRDYNIAKFLSYNHEIIYELIQYGINKFKKSNFTLYKEQFNIYLEDERLFYFLILNLEFFEAYNNMKKELNMKIKKKLGYVVDEVIGKLKDKDFKKLHKLANSVTLNIY